MLHSTGVAGSAPQQSRYDNSPGLPKVSSVPKEYHAAVPLLISAAASPHRAVALESSQPVPVDSTVTPLALEIPNPDTVAKHGTPSVHANAPAVSLCLFQLGSECFNRSSCYSNLTVWQTSRFCSLFHRRRLLKYVSFELLFHTHARAHFPILIF